MPPSKTAAVWVDERDCVFAGVAAGHFGAAKLKEEVTRRSGLRNVTSVSYRGRDASSYLTHIFEVTGEMPERRWSRGMMIAKRMRRLEREIDQS